MSAEPPHFRRQTPAQGEKVRLAGEYAKKPGFTPVSVATSRQRPLSLHHVRHCRGQALDTNGSAARCTCLRGLFCHEKVRQASCSVPSFLHLLQEHGDFWCWEPTCRRHPCT
jgi:hypothetical protein